MPNPSIEGDVQGLAPLAAPHVKRYAVTRVVGEANVWRLK